MLKFFLIFCLLGGGCLSGFVEKEPLSEEEFEQKLSELIESCEDDESRENLINFINSLLEQIEEE